MATAAQAIERIAEATGILPNTLVRFARGMREADTPDDAPLWPKGSAGPGKAAHVDNFHLSNLGTAVIGTDTIASAPDMVRVWNDLVPLRDGKLAPGVHQPEGFDSFREHAPAGERRNAGLPGNTFASAFRLLIDYLARSGDPRLVDHWRQYGLTIRLSWNPVGGRLFNPVAQIFYTPSPANPAGWCAQTYTPRQLPLMGNEQQQWAGMFVKSGALSFPLIETLADLWRDTLAHRARQQDARGSLPLSPEPSMPPASGKDENAASPARDTAHNRDQPAQTELGGDAQCHPTGEREKSQPSSESQADRSHQHVWSKPHDAFGNGGAYGAAA